MFVPVHNQVLVLCVGAFGTSPVESMYVDAHQPCLGARCSKLSLQYALPKHPACDSVFDNKYARLFDARPNAIKLYRAVYICYQH